MFHLSYGIRATHALTKHQRSEMAVSSSVVLNSDGTSTNATAQLIQFNPVSQLPIKLSGSNNFTTWKAQIELLLHGHDLFGYLDGSITSPPSTITENDKRVPNPAYKVWFRQDKLIQNAILASVDPTLASVVATAFSSKAAWDSLHTSYANKSHTRILNLRDQLSRLSKDIKSVAEYLREIRAITDELSIAGSPVSNSELVVKILSGLGPEYSNIAVAIRTRENPISYDELSGLLQDQEICLKAYEIKNTSSTITAAVAHRGNTEFHQTTSPPKRSFQSSRRNYTPGQWRNLPSSKSSPNSWRAPLPNDVSHFNARIRCQLCDKPGHVAKVCRSRSHNHIEAKANFATNTAPWIVDSGASHHITSSAQNFSELHGYNGPDVISMGDGKTIPISNIGTTKLCTSDCSFKLSNALCAPAIKRNLISVSKFCQDNSASIEFFPSKFFVKDLKTGTPLVCGRNKAGLYEWPSSTSFIKPTIHLATRQPSLHLWHQRLGHLNLKSLLLLLNNYSLPYSHSENFDVCNSCACNKTHRLPFATTSFETTRPLQIIYSDLWGPSPVLSIDKKMYYVIFVDHHTRYFWLYTLKNKNEVSTIFPQFQTLVERHFQNKILSLYTDGGGEFEGLKSYLNS